MDILIVQHAEKEPVGGEPGLTAQGQVQALATARFLAQSHWDRLYCSPMRRTIETAAPIGRATGLAIVVDERLRERMNWAGNEVQPFEGFLADWKRATIERDWRPPSGDSSREAGQRFADVLDEIAAEANVARALVVTHGGITVDLLRNLWADDALKRIAPAAVTNGPPSAALTRLTSDSRGWKLVAFATVGHLAGK